MIADKCFTNEWINARRGQIGKVDPVLLEKSIHAFALLCGLARSNLPFVFKGGTSLMLLLPAIRRLSIDVDISMETPRAEYEPLLTTIGQTPPFKRYEPDDRGERGLPKRTHFKFFYDSTISQRPDYVLLDILDERNMYPETEVRPVMTSFIELEQPASVRMPTLTGLLGDKLAAFAPTTIGILYDQDKSMQIVKQLFDIGELFGVVDDLRAVDQAYSTISEAESQYRGGNHSRLQVLDDTFSAAIKLCGIGLKGIKDDAHSIELKDGIARISSHLVNARFRLEEAKIAASRAALLAAALKKQRYDPNLPALRWTPGRPLSQAGIDLPISLVHLSRLKTFLPEAFWNLHTAQSIT